MMDNYKKDQKQDLARYVKDTKDHVMNIIQDDGVFRHIQMQSPNTSRYMFNITTFNGYLVVTGDMGSFVFTRLHDMFDFHRLSWEKKDTLISYGYWAEKCEAASKHGGTHEFDEESFIKSAREAFKEGMQGVDGFRKHYRDFKDEIIDCGVSNSSEAVRLVCDWSYADNDYNANYPFSDFWDYAPFEKPSFHFKWICWAIASTIKQYDETKTNK